VPLDIHVDDQNAPVPPEGKIGADRDRGGRFPNPAFIACQRKNNAHFAFLLRWLLTQAIPARLEQA
jgi:hypothetical protein